MVNGAKTFKIQLFNVLSSTYGTDPVVIKVHDSSRNIAGGGKTFSGYIAKIFLPEMNRLDPEKRKFDLLMVDGDSNVQGEGGVVKDFFSVPYYPQGRVYFGSLL